MKSSRKASVTRRQTNVIKKVSIIWNYCPFIFNQFWLIVINGKTWVAKNTNKNTITTNNKQEEVVNPAGEKIILLQVVLIPEWNCLSVLEHYKPIKFIGSTKDICSSLEIHLVEHGIKMKYHPLISSNQ